MSEILTKVSFLRIALLNVNYNIIGLNETWLNDSVFDSELGFTNYNFYSDDHNNLSNGKKQGGGILIDVIKKMCFEFLHLSIVVGIE